MQQLVIDPKFHALIPPLTAEERAALEASLLAEGCRDALVVWNGIILDGHNRYEICRAHGLPFETVARDFETRDAAKEWILRNQLARRNLNDYSRGALALRLKGVIAARAKARMLAGKPADPVANLPQGKTRDVVAEVAGVSGRTIDKVEAVERDAPEPVKVAARAGDISTNRAYEITRAALALVDVVGNRAAHQPEQQTSDTCFHARPPVFAFTRACAYDRCGAGAPPPRAGAGRCLYRRSARILPLDFIRFRLARSTPARRNRHVIPLVVQVLLNCDARQRGVGGECLAQLALKRFCQVASQRHVHSDFFFFCHIPPFLCGAHHVQSIAQCAALSIACILTIASSAL